MSPVAGAGATGIPAARPSSVPEANPQARKARMVRVTAARYAVAQLSAMPESTSVDYDDDHEPDVSDGWPDGWEDPEPDPAHPIENTDDDGHAPRGRRPVIELFIDARGGLGHRVAPRHPASLFGPLADELSELEDWQDALAQELISCQEKSIRANAPHEAYHRLDLWTQRDIANRVGRFNADWLSRHRADLIRCPWGTVPLQFFTWGIAQDRLKQYQRLLDLVLARDTPHDRATALALAGKIAHDSGDDDERETAVERLRKLVPLARELRGQRFRLAKLRRNCAAWHDAAIRLAAGEGSTEQDKERVEKLNARLRARGMEFWRFAVAGWEPEGGDLWLRSA